MYSSLSLFTIPLTTLWNLETITLINWSTEQATFGSSSFTLVTVSGTFVYLKFFFLSLQHNGPHSKLLAPTYKLAAELLHGHVKLGAVNQQNKELFERFQITGVPFLMVYDGKKFKAFEGDYKLASIIKNGLVQQPNDDSFYAPPTEILRTTTNEPIKKKFDLVQRRCTFFI